jgi:hypothetical protein
MYGVGLVVTFVEHLTVKEVLATMELRGDRLSWTAGTGEPKRACRERKMKDVPKLNPEQWTEVDVYWTVHDGRRFSISSSERDAWESLKSLYDYAENPEGWAVEHSRERLPTSSGKIVEGEGEIVELDDEGAVASRVPFTPVKVFWNCPWCGEQHNTDLDQVHFDRTSRHPNPSLWFCEHGEGIVLVTW